MSRLQKPGVRMAGGGALPLRWHLKRTAAFRGEALLRFFELTKNSVSRYGLPCVQSENVSFP